MMKAGTDWRKASRQYSRERFKTLSNSLMKDGALTDADGDCSETIDRCDAWFFGCIQHQFDGYRPVFLYIC
jgi:hypothetical protein